MRGISAGLGSHRSEGRHTGGHREPLAKPGDKGMKEQLRDVWPDIWALVKPRRWLLALGLVLIGINRAAGLVLPASSKYLIDDIIGKRRWYYLLSALVTIPGLLFIFATGFTGGSAGLKFSIDYTGGTLWEIRFADQSVTPAQVSELLSLVDSGEISGKQAKDVYAAIEGSDKLPRAVVEERGMRVVSDTGAIQAACERVLAAHPEQVKSIVAGKKGVLGFLVGQVMKETKGQANPKLVSEMLEKLTGQA